MRQRLHYLLRYSLQALLGLFIFIHCPAQDASRHDTIAQIADRYAITFPQVQQFVRDHQYPYMFRKYPAEPYDKALDDMIVGQLKRIDFFARGLNRNGQSLQRVRRSINEELVIRYYTTQFYSRYINEDSVRSAYREMGKEVFFQQVVLAKPMGASREEIDSLKLLARSISTRIRSGEDVVTLAAQYSRDRNSESANALRRVDWELSLSSSVNYVAFRLPHGAVRIVDNGELIHVVKIVRVTKVDVPPFSKVKGNIRKALEARYSDFAHEEFEKAKQGLLDETRVKWNPEALKQLAQWSSIPGFYQTVYADTLRAAIAHGRNVVILKYLKTQVDLREYLRLLNDVMIWGNHTSVDQDAVKKFVLEAVRTNMIVAKAVALDLEKDVFTPATTNPILKNEIVRLYDRHEIEVKIPSASEAALREFYQANRDSLYYQLAKVNIYAVIDSNKVVIEKMKTRLEQNVPFEKLAPEILVKAFIRTRDGILQTHFGVEPPFLAEAAFKLKLNEIAGPIEYTDPANGKQYALIQCVETREEKQLTYEEVRKTIADDFVNYQRNRIARSVQEGLKKHYGVTIYKDVWQRNLSSIGIESQR
ncbi:MAG: peptidyl-prolyl cis-trans isomerase [Ignavibacteria bacterium]|nr:peptidyl-prolyl cis-trans isomerase [Ignavibacteria bacterium]